MEKHNSARIALTSRAGTKKTIENNSDSLKVSAKIWKRTSVSHNESAITNDADIVYFAMWLSYLLGSKNKNE